MKKRIFAVFLAAALAAGAASADEYLLLKGDLHCHSSFSHDSTVPYSDVLAFVHKAGMDFVALTEHDSTVQLQEDLSSEDVLVLPGIEMTFLSGHYNVIGLRDFRTKLNMSRKALEAYMQSLIDAGGLVQINHPNVGTYFSDYGYIDALTMVEVLNSGASSDDYQTLADWQALLCEGRRLVATCGSDAHRLSARTTYNNVFSKERSIDGVVEGVRAGRLYITTSKNGPSIRLVCDGQIMGDSVQARKNQFAGLAISGIPLFCDVYVYTDKGLYSRAPADGVYSLAIPTAEFSFIRCEVWQHGKGIIALSNPLYIQHAEAK